MKILNESDQKELHLIISDSEGSIQDLIETIKDYTQMGHTFEVVIDPGDSDYERSFYIDGDGSDKIRDVEVYEIKDEDND